MSYRDAVSAYSNMHIWVAEGNWKYQVIGQLIYILKFPSDKIINFEPVVHKRACAFIENGIVCGRSSLMFCCRMSGRGKSPRLECKANIDDSIDEFLNLRQRMSENISRGNDGCCEGCIEIKEDYFERDPRISIANYSSGGVCNLKCIYCNSSAKYSKGTWDTDIDFTEVLDALRKRNMLSDTSIFEISPGEISLHKNRKQIYSQFKNTVSTMVMSNATVFDDDLAECLKKSEANLCVSVDAGTRETYKRVRGVDLYEKLCNNLKRYSEVAPGQLDLKYIFVPGENDNFDDVEGFAELCKDVKPSAAFLTYDIFNPVQIAPETTIKAVRHLIDLLEDRSIIWKINSNVLGSVGTGKF